eukprot:m.164540 g.164540  ORF g.164540 m.164540 type:complete len:1433 (-) comp17138_c0_seq2:376-4674(-)
MGLISAYNKYTYGWISSIITKGRKVPLEFSDTTLPENLDAQRAFDRFTVEWAKERGQAAPNLTKAIKSVAKKEFMVTVFFRFLCSVTLLVGAFYFVRTLVRVGDRRRTDGNGELLSCMFFLCCALLTYFQQVTQDLATRTGTALRGALISAVYRKAQKIEAPESAASDVLNLVSNDCMRVYEAATAIHALWAAPIESLVIVILLIILIGEIGLIALGMISLILTAQIFIGYRVASLREKNIAATDLRVQVMQEILTSIKLVKFYAWEEAFMSVVASLRRRELKLMKKGALIKTINLMIVFVIPPIIALTLFSVYVNQEGSLISDIAFTTLSLFNTLRFPLVVLPRAIRSMAEAKTAVARLQEFLLRDETTAQLSTVKAVGHGANGALQANGVGGMEGRIYIEEASLGYAKQIKEELGAKHDKDLEDDEQPRVRKHMQEIEVLSDVSLQLEPGEHMAVVGPVASGKSTLILSILGEARVLSGRLSATGQMAYVPQTPWIQGGTVRSNILFGLPYDEERYKRCIYACALTRDLEIMPFGDMTAVAPRGINLSGGQRQRISLARAAYSYSNVFLLDNPLSAVDWFTGNHIMEHCIKGIMGKATVIMVTHELEMLPQFDKVCVVREGSALYAGPYNREVLGFYFPMLLDAPEEEADEAIEEEEGEGDSAQPKKKAPAKTAAPPQSNDSEKPKNTAPAVTDHTAISDVKQVKGHYIMVWIRAGATALAITSGFIFVLTQLARIFSDWYISQWVDKKFGLTELEHNRNYGILVAFFLLMLFTRGTVFYIFSRRAATDLHNRTFFKILRSPMAVFSLTPLGNVLNLFAKDQDTVDEILPDTIHMTLIYLLILMTTILLVCSVLPIYSIVAAAFFILTVIFVLYYIKAAAGLKKLVLYSSSPLFSFVSESMDGMAVIRAFRAQDRMVGECLRLVNTNHSAMFTLEQLQLWLGLRLGLIASLLVFATAIYCVLDRENIEPSTTGLAISNTIQALVFYSWFVRGIADIAAYFGAVERIQFFEETLPSEKAAIEPHNRPRDSWPERGVVEFKSVKLRYLPWLDLALRGVSFTINAGEKIGVVGRTGSGKSTLLMALFRMFEPEEGTVIVDGMDVSKMGLTDLRSHLAIIPQEPVMFKGTIRSNLDPFQEHSNQKIWEALEVCHMKQAVQKLPKQLDSEVTLGGENFSLGQRQLICLGRAYLRESAVLCLDEATSAMDLETDALIQRTIRLAFANRTVITIAHRLDTIIDSDRILALDNGVVREFDSPANLLRRGDSLFSALVDQVGAHRDGLLQRALEHETELANRKPTDAAAAERNLRDELRTHRKMTWNLSVLKQNPEAMEVVRHLASSNTLTRRTLRTQRASQEQQNKERTTLANLFNQLEQPTAAPAAPVEAAEASAEAVQPQNSRFTPTVVPLQPINPGSGSSGSKPDGSYDTQVSEV